MSERYFPERYWPSEVADPGRRDFLKTLGVLGIGGVAFLGGRKIWSLTRVLSSISTPTPEPTSTPTPEPKITPTPEVLNVTPQNEFLPIAWMPDSVLRYSNQIKDTAKKYEVDPNLVATIIACESGGNPCAVSNSGALGLMQVMYFHSAGRNLFPTETNIEVGVKYLSDQFEQFESWEKAVKAYNGGPGCVLKDEYSDQTRQYWHWISGMWAEVNHKESATFNAWKQAGGNDLLEEARLLHRNGAAYRVVSFALEQWHKPYLYGGEGPEKYDCSGLVQKAFKQAGISIPRTATDQWYSAVGRKLNPADKKRPGDLVFFTLDYGRSSDHVGMVIFPLHQMFIEASGMEGLIKISSLRPNALYRSDLAGRVLGYKRYV